MASTAKKSPSIRSKRSQKEDTMEEIRLLIVDDHTMFRQGLEKLLETNPLFNVVAGAKDGLEAIKLTEELKPDVVLMDIDMPGMDGLDTTQQISAAHPDVKVVMLTMYGSKDLVTLAMEAGASGYVMKNADAESLFRSIISVYEGNISLDSLATKKLIEGYRGLQVKGLTKREREVTNLLVKGKTRKEIAELLHISIRTVDTYRYKAFRNLGIKTAGDLARYAIKEGHILPSR